MFVGVLIVCIVIGIRSFSLYKESKELSKRQEALAAKIESEEKRKEDLEDLEKYMQTKRYMEEVAKTKLGLVYPNEILIQPDNK
ncbi:MAG: septum formation initiator family protein [Lachnospiraceae bacterium]|nr:septum formation initiator family protein [Lachnospiraceae bacterium]